MNGHSNPNGTNPGALNGFAEGVAKRVAGGSTYHVARLLPEGSPKDPDRPDVWKDEGALHEWTRGLPERDTVFVLRIVNANPDTFENETRSTTANDTGQ